MKISTASSGLLSYLDFWSWVKCRSFAIFKLLTRSSERVTKNRTSGAAGKLATYSICHIRMLLSSITTAKSRQYVNIHSDINTNLFKFKMTATKETLDGVGKSQKLPSYVQELESKPKRQNLWIDMWIFPVTMMILFYFLPRIYHHNGVDNNWNALDVSHLLLVAFLYFSFIPCFFGPMIKDEANRTFYLDGRWAKIFWILDHNLVKVYVCILFQ